jgi:hypothetical protein
VKRAASDRERARLVARLARLAVGDARLQRDALSAEQWASALLGSLNIVRTWPAELRVGLSTELVTAIEQVEEVGALVALRSLSAVGVAEQRAVALAAAERLAGHGLDEPAWVVRLAAALPVAAALQFEPVFDDGVVVLVDFAGPGCEPHSLGVYIDHNDAGIPKDAFIAQPLPEIHPGLKRVASNGLRIDVRDLDLGEARSRLAASLVALDLAAAPSVDDDLWKLRALIDARLSAMPEGGDMPDERECGRDPGDARLDTFLASGPGAKWRQDTRAAHALDVVLEFGTGHNHGGPTRWSPAVVERFLVSWLPAWLAGRDGEADLTRAVVEVLPDWATFAGERRGVTPAALTETVGAVREYGATLLARETERAT